MVRTLLILTMLAVMPHSLANAEFVIDAFDAPGTFFNTPSTFSVADDFGNTYDITREFTLGTGAAVGGSGVSLDIGVSSDPNAFARLDYDFSPSSTQSPSNTFALGYYANNFRIEGLNTTPNDGVDISVIATRQNGNVGQFDIENINFDNDIIFFDLENLGDVGVLNDLATLSFVFTSDNGDFGTSIDFQNFSLVANPEPTSAASFGLLGLVGLVCSTRRRKK